MTYFTIFNKSASVRLHCSLLLFRNISVARSSTNTQIAQTGLLKWNSIHRYGNKSFLYFLHLVLVSVTPRAFFTKKEEETDPERQFTEKPCLRLGYPNL